MLNSAEQEILIDHKHKYIKNAQISCSDKPRMLKISCSAELSMKLFFITSGPDQGLHYLHFQLHLLKGKVSHILIVVQTVGGRGPLYLGHSG